MAATARPDRSFIDPHRLYTLKGFQQDAGISPSRIREARQNGVDLPRLKVGRRMFVKGTDGISYIERLAQL